MRNRLVRARLAVGLTLVLAAFGCVGEGDETPSRVGTITGVVRRSAWKPGAALPEYEPVAGARVTGVDITGERLWALAAPGVPSDSNVAVTGADGSYELLDLHFDGGLVWIVATLDGQSMGASAYESVPSNPEPGHRYVASANVTFAAKRPDGIGSRRR